MDCGGLTCLRSLEGENGEKADSNLSLRLFIQYTIQEFRF
jgi:hypothetical protein